MLCRTIVLSTILGRCKLNLPYNLKEIMNEDQLQIEEILSLVSLISRNSYISHVNYLLVSHRESFVSNSINH